LEVEDGVLRLTLKPKQKPVEEYLKAQGRFRRLSEDQIKFVQSEVDTRRRRLLENEGKNILI